MNRALIVAAILVLFGGGYALYKGLIRPPADTETPPAVRVVVETVKAETETYTIDMQYPRFGIPTIDADIKGKIDADLAAFKTIPPNPPDSATPKNEFTGIFENEYIGSDVISVKLVLSQYTGGAHPMTIVSGLTYDRTTGRQLLQDDAFAMLGLSVDEVSARATEELKKELGEAFFEEGASSNPENFSSFVVSENEITFIFQPYQVAPYAAGVQEVSFPRTGASASQRQVTDCQAACQRQCGANADCTTECYAECRAGSQ